MTITIGSTILCDGQTRSTNGSATGPNNLRMSVAPGVVMREYVGADRVQGEHVKCDHGTLTFDVERIFPSVTLALEYLNTDTVVTGTSIPGFLKEASEGTLKFDSTTVFAHAAVTSRQVAQVGCAVAVSYTIEG